jgi:hypothetical protein
VAEAGPGPIFWFLYQSASYWVAVHIFQLFYLLALGEDIEVIVTRLPEGAFLPLDGYG